MEKRCYVWSSCLFKEAQAEREHKSRCRLRTPARIQAKGEGEPPSRCFADVGVQIEHMIEEVNVISVRVLGWVPVNYDLAMQQVVHAAYEKNQGCHHARGP